MAGTWLPSKPSLHEPQLTSNGSSAACHYRRTSLTAHKVRKLPSPLFGPAHTNILLFHLASQSQTSSFCNKIQELDKRSFLNTLSSRACGQLVETCSYRFPNGSGSLCGASNRGGARAAKRLPWGRRVPDTRGQVGSGIATGPRPQHDSHPQRASSKCRRRLLSLTSHPCRWTSPLPTLTCRPSRPIQLQPRPLRFPTCTATPWRRPATTKLATLTRLSNRPPAHMINPRPLYISTCTAMP